MPDYQNAHLLLDTKTTHQGNTGWISPSNIAIVKYWGKYGQQMPRNPNISLTLDAAHTQMTLQWHNKLNPADKNIALDFIFHNQPNEAFRLKMAAFLESMVPIFPFLQQLQLTVSSQNSFPHSAGIASSASAMSALALCLCSLERELFGTLHSHTDFLRKASYIARLGSGSACRSVYPYAAAWGKTPDLPAADDYHAIPFASELHPVFRTMKDAILLVSRAEKSVSSRAGHALMEGNPFAAPRYEQAKNNLSTLLRAMHTGDIETFGRIAEDEALTLHALMMASSPSYILMRPNSLRLIEMVRDYRATTNLPLYFTLDAGPNLHLLYPQSDAATIENFIRAELAPLCENSQWIADCVGAGPKEIALG